LSIADTTLNATGGSGGGTSDGLAASILADTPRAYYKMDETSGTTIVDSSGNGYDIAVPGSGYELAAGRLIPGDSTKFARCTVDLPALTSLGLSPPMNYDYTICFVLQRCGDSLTYESAFRLFRWAGSGESGAANFQLEIPRVAESAVRITALWEYSAGTDSLINFAAFYPFDEPCIVHVRKNSTTKKLSIFINGQFWREGSYTNEPTGGTDPSMAMFIGTANGYGGHWAFFDTALTEARIAAHATAAGFFEPTTHLRPRVPTATARTAARQQRPGHRWWPRLSDCM